MKIAKVISIIALTTALPASAGDAWTLDQCIDYAISHNINVASRQIQSQSASLDVTAAKDRFLPSLNGYANQSFNFGRGLTADNTYANRNTSSFSAGASLSLPLFQGLQGVRNLDYTRANLRAVLEQTEAAKDDVRLNVIAQYLQALYTREMMDVARQRVSISERELARRQTLLEAGKIPELDIYEARSQVAQDQLYLTNCVNDSIMALLDLAQMLNLSPEQTAAFSVQPVADCSVMLPDPADVYARALGSNHAVRASELSVAASEKYIRLQKASYLPTLSFTAGLGTNYYNTHGMPNDPFSSQMRHNFAQQIGFSLSVPVFNAFSTRNSVRRAHIQHESALLDLDDSRQQLYKSIMQAYTSASNAQRKQASAKAALESALKAFEAMQVKYDNGRATQTEYDKTRSEYISSLAESVLARYELILRSRILDFYNR